MNTNADPEGLVRHGNERVLRARFNDARFFWNVDQQKKLADRVADLAHVTFQAKLGSYLEKTERMHGARAENSAAEADALPPRAPHAGEGRSDHRDGEGVHRSAGHCRRPLRARSRANREEVCAGDLRPVQAGEHGGRDSLTPTGRIVALADKLDTLRGCFAIGLVPTGSKDPFALRRAAQGVVKILVEGGLDLNARASCSAAIRQLREFMLDRVRYYFREIRGFAYDEVNAVLAAGWDNLMDIEARLDGAQRRPADREFEPLAASFKRIKNILRRPKFTAPGASMRRCSKPGPEARSLQRDSTRRIAAADASYRQALGAIAACARGRSVLRQSASQRPGRARPAQPAHPAEAC